MMAAARIEERLIDRLPPVRGRYAESAPLAHTTWFRVGGTAEVLFRPADADDLAAFMAQSPTDVPITVLGVGSNILVRDGGIPGVVVRLGRGFAALEAEDEAVVAGAGALCLNVARTGLAAGIGGLEFMSGVPGTVGGALRMNAGAYGGEMKDIVDWAELCEPGGRIRRLGSAELGFAYRHCDVPEDRIFLRARLVGRPEPTAAIRERLDAVAAAREESQPLRTRTGGSTFRNPPGAKAWELIDRAGCRGLRRGGAMVSEKHCNFLINTGDASAADLEGLGEEVRRRVREATGVVLEWEIRRVGVPGRAVP